MRYYFALLFFSIYTVSIAQCTFEKHYKIYPGAGPIVSMVECPDGGLLTVAGAYHDSLNPGSGAGGRIDMCMVKSDSCGNFQWQTVYGNGTDEANGVVSVASGYLVCGTTSSGKALSNMRLVKLAPDGTIQWDSFYTASVESRCLTMAKRINHPNVILGGYVRKFLPGGPGRKTHPVVIEVDTNGVEIRQKEFKIFQGDTFSMERIEKILQPNVHTYFFFGVSSGDLFLIKTDSELNVEWIRKPVPYLSNIQFLGASLSTDSQRIVVSVSGRLTSVTREYLVTLNLQGDTVSSLLFRTDTFSIPNYVFNTRDSGFIVGLKLTKLNSQLNFEWMALPNAEPLMGIELKSGGYAVCGVSSRYPSILELWVARLDRYGRYIKTSEAPRDLILEGFEMYPNPVQEILNLRHSDNRVHILNIGIYDASGHQIQSSTMSEKTLSFSTTHLSDGMYYLEVKSVRGRWLLKKFVVSHCEE
jgi:hypothetical protein